MFDPAECNICRITLDREDGVVMVVKMSGAYAMVCPGECHSIYRAQRALEHMHRRLP